MSWGTCYKASNNIHAGFPALMSEGNLYTDYDSACKMNNTLKEKIGIKSTNNKQSATILCLIQNSLSQIHEPILNVLRKYIPIFGNLDLTPLIVFVVIHFISGILRNSII